MGMELGRSLCCMESIKEMSLHHLHNKTRFLKKRMKSWATVSSPKSFATLFFIT